MEEVQCLLSEKSACLLTQSTSYHQAVNVLKPIFSHNECKINVCQFGVYRYVKLILKSNVDEAGRTLVSSRQKNIYLQELN